MNSARFRHTLSVVYATETLSGSRLFHASSARRTLTAAVSASKGGSGGFDGISVFIWDPSRFGIWWPNNNSAVCVMPSRKPTTFCVFRPGSLERRRYAVCVRWLRVRHVAQDGRWPRRANPHAQARGPSHHSTPMRHTMPGQVPSRQQPLPFTEPGHCPHIDCLLYTSDAADE